MKIVPIINTNKDNTLWYLELIIAREILAMQFEKKKNLKKNLPKLILHNR